VPWAWILISLVGVYAQLRVTSGARARAARK
jgi:hypothetical protein